MKRIINEIAKCAVVGGLGFGLTIWIYTLYAIRTGAPTIW